VDRRGVYGILAGKPVGNKQLGRPWRRLKDNIKMDLLEVGWGMYRIDQALDRDRWRALVNAGMNLRIPQNAWKFLTS
jgi:hypothetical protein